MTPNAWNSAVVMWTRSEMAGERACSSRANSCNSGGSRPGSQAGGKSPVADPAALTKSRVREGETDPVVRDAEILGGLRNEVRGRVGGERRIEPAGV